MPAEEIKELESYVAVLKGKISRLEKELNGLIRAVDDISVLIYARRVMEVIVIDICENRLKRDRGTEPLERIIDKLNKDKIIPVHVIVSMKNLNRISTFGAHPKDFSERQVREALIALTTVMEWYVTDKGLKEIKTGGGDSEETIKAAIPIEGEYNLEHVSVGRLVAGFSLALASALFWGFIAVFVSLDIYYKPSHQAIQQ